ncbi:MAG: hypothetical protein AAF152_12810 [Cyanobacteria bacterium P01_A01_bin.114]
MKKIWTSAIASSLTCHLALLTCLLPVPAMAQSIDNQATDNGDSVPYRLLFQLLDALPSSENPPRLNVGSEFPNLPIDLPIPQAGDLRWSLIGQSRYSILSSLVEDTESFTLFFEIPKSRSQAETAYLEQLQTSGWHSRTWQEISAKISPEPPPPDPNAVEGRGQSFAIGYDAREEIAEADASPPEPLIFCEQNSHAAITLNFLETAANRTELRLNLTTGQLSSICNPEVSTASELSSESFNESDSEVFSESDLPPELALFYELRSEVESFEELLLPPDDNTRIEWSDNGDSNSIIDIQASIQTPLSLDALAEHYATQIQQQGWEIQSRDGNNFLQWNVWSRANESDPDRPGSLFQATIQLFATERPDQYFGNFVVQENSRQAERLAPQDFDIQSGTLPITTALQVLEPGRQSDYRPYEVWVEQLPPRLPAELQIPADTTVLGSDVVSTKTRAVLETSLHPQTVKIFYRDSLSAAGWHTAENFTDSYGAIFETSEPQLFYASAEVFCQPETEHEIALYTLPGPNSLTTIQLHVYPSGEYSPCRLERTDLSVNSNFWGNAPLPQLSAPPETTVLPGNGGGTIPGGEQGYYKDAVYLQSGLAADALVAHYAEQLHQAGWSERTATESEGSFVSLWQIETDRGSWQGALSLIAQPESDQWAGEFTLFSEDQHRLWAPVE